LASLFVQVSEDLSFAQSNFPDSKTTQYLNQIAGKAHKQIYRNKKEDKSRFVTFWTAELPIIIFQSRKELLYSLLIFGISALIGAFSSANDNEFVRLIMGDDYVNMTLNNMENEDPMGVYKKMKELDMFLAITVNNVRVSFTVFALGVFFSFGSAFLLFQNGVMLGSFQYFMHDQGWLVESLLTIWIHGTLEISAIIIAGAAGLVMGNSLLFPRTYSRLESFKRGAKKGIKIIIGLVPIFIIAGFLEGFVTRHTELPNLVRASIILLSLIFVLLYFVWYPLKLSKKYRIESPESS
jgi:uncharacterized membrane protein SpoIIM required for sporulation